VHVWWVSVARSTCEGDAFCCCELPPACAHTTSSQRASASSGQRTCSCVQSAGASANMPWLRSEFLPQFMVPNTSCAIMRGGAGPRQPFLAIAGASSAVSQPFLSRFSPQRTRPPRSAWPGCARGAHECACRDDEEAPAADRRDRPRRTASSRCGRSTSSTCSRPRRWPTSLRS
jgi:hypothetical protein